MSTTEQVYDIDAIRAELAEDRVATEVPALNDALVPVVQSAQDRGIDDLKVVILEDVPEVGTDARDLAQRIVDLDGGTVVVRSPAYSGSASDQLSRSALETAEYDMVQRGNYPEGLDWYITMATQHHIPWSEINYILIAAFVIAAVGLPVLWWRRAKAANAAAATEATEQPAKEETRV